MSNQDERDHQRRLSVWIAAIAVRVYCARLEDPTGGGAGSVKRMLEKDHEAGEAIPGTRLRRRAIAYIPIVRATIEALGIPDVYLKEAADVEPW